MTDNITAAAFTRATQIVRELKQKLRDAGKREREILTSDVRSSITRHLAEHPRILERALKDVERWRTKFKTKEKSRSR